MEWDSLVFCPVFTSIITLIGIKLVTQIYYLGRDPEGTVGKSGLICERGREEGFQN